MAPRVGPRGVTIQDVAKVASTGARAMNAPNPPGTLGGYTFTRNTPPPPVTPTADIIAQLMGGPVAGYGLKYAGFPTEGQYKAAILGSAYRLPEAADLARQQAQQAREGEYDQYLGQMMDIYDPYGVYSDRSAMQPVVLAPGRYSATSPLGQLGAEEVVPAEYTRGIQQAPKVTQAQTMLDQARARLAAAQAIATGQGIRYEPMRADIATGQSFPYGPEKYSTPGVRELNMARRADLMQMRNIMGGLEQGPIAGNIAELQDAEAGVRQAEIDLANATRDETGRRRALATGAAVGAAQGITTRALPGEQFAEQVSSIPLYEYARQIAVQNYGMDPATAAGLYTPELDLAYRQTQREAELAAQNIDFSQTDREMIYNQYGADALAEYDALKAQGAYEKATQGALTAEEEAADYNIMNNTGVAPSQAAGDFPVARARQLLTDPDFVSYLNQSKTELANMDALTMEDKTNGARKIAAALAEQTGDPVAAQILYNALTSFDYLFAVGS